MISWVLEKALGLFGLNQIAVITIGLLMVSTAGAGYLLKLSYEDNGEQTALVSQYQAANQHSIDTLNFERDQFKKLQQKLIERENEYLTIDFELNNARKQLNEIPDTSGCLDVDLGSDFWLSINPSDPLG